MKKIYLLFVFLTFTIGYSQTNGISYQALILNPKPQNMPGINEVNTALVNQKICLQFVIQDEQKQLEYQETVSTTTDDLGMVNVIIGSGNQTGGYAIDFKSVSWNSATKTLNVGVNISGSCGSFTEVSDQIFNSVPFAFSAENVTGIVAIENGGTNASNVVDAKINLNLGNVDNTSDVLKPVSAATQTSLNSKVDKVAGKALSTEDYSTAEKTKLGAIIGTNTGDQNLSSFATTTNLALKVDKEAGKGLSTEDYSSGDKTKLTAITGTNTGDQDLSSYATTTNLALKVDKEAGKGLSTEDYSSAEKTKLAAITGTNTGDQDLSSYATTTNLALKVDKEVGKGLSTEDYSIAEKTKLAAITGTNTGDQDLSSYATTINLALKVDKEAGKGLSTEDYSNAEKTKLAAITGTNTGDQDLSSYATTTNLALKVDKEVGKGLSTEDYSIAEKTKLAAITGTNTGDQDLSSFATNRNLDFKANVASPTFTGTVSGITATMVGLPNLDNTSDVNKPISTATQSALDLKATLDSPSFIGIPSLPIGSIGITQIAGNNSQSIATTAFVTEALKTSTVGKFVDLTTNQTISGEKTFNNDIIANGLTIGKGLGQNDQNTAFGSGALGSSNADGTRNTAIGFFAMKEYVGTSFDNNTAVGYFNMIGLTTGGGNTSIGAETMFHVASGNNNTGIGNQSLIDIEGDNNVGVGKRAGDGLVSGSNNTFLGTDSRTTSLGSSISNSTAIGYGAIVETDNTIQLGNTDVNLINTSANVTAASYIKLGGTSSQYLMADGSVLAVQVSAVEIADEFSATAEQTDFNLSQIPSGNCKVKMFVNGIRVSNTSYSWAGTALTYNPINNGGYDLSLNDRIQFDYYTETP